MDRLEEIKKRYINEKHFSEVPITQLDVDWLILEMERLRPLADNGFKLARIVQKDDKEIERLRKVVKEAFAEGFWERDLSDDQNESWEKSYARQALEE